MTGSELAVGVTGCIPGALTAPDPIVEEVKALSGRRYLTPAEARRRYALILRWWGAGGRVKSHLAREIECSPSNVSRLVKAAQRAFVSEGVQS